MRLLRPCFALFGLLAVLFVTLSSARPAEAHWKHGPERHEVRLTVAGDRLVIDYTIKALDENAPPYSHDPGMALQQRAGQLIALQRVKFDGELVPLGLRDLAVQRDHVMYQLDTGAGSLSAGRHELVFTALSANTAAEFELTWQAATEARFIGEARRKGAASWSATVAVGGSAAGAAPGSATKIAGVWTRLTEALRSGGGAKFWALIVGIAFFLGMIHAVTPGHGKSLAAAYLMDRRGGVGDAAVFAGSVTLTHTILVFLLALIAYVAGEFVDRARLAPYLQVFGGSVMVLIGVWLLWIRIRGDDGHHHDHDHDHDHPRRAEGPWGGALLGMAAGAAPCPEALALLFVAIGAGRPGAALVMLVSFSLALATVLFLIGLAVINAGPLLARLFKRDPARVARVLSIVSAVLIVGIGILFVAAAVTSL